MKPKYRPVTDRHIADSVVSQFAPRLPPSLSLWNASKVAEYLNVGARQVLERYSLMDGFPAAIRLPNPTGGRGHPRWKATEIIAWAAKYQESNTQPHPQEKSNV